MEQGIIMLAGGLRQRSQLLSQCMTWALASASKQRGLVRCLACTMIHFSFYNAHGQCAVLAGDHEKGYRVTESFVDSMLERFRERGLIHSRFAFEIVMAVSLVRLESSSRNTPCDMQECTAPNAAGLRWMHAMVCWAAQPPFTAATCCGRVLRSHRSLAAAVGRHERA